MLERQLARPIFVTRNAHAQKFFEVGDQKVLAVIATDG
jgi:hypothetical protein